MKQLAGNKAVVAILACTTQEQPKWNLSTLRHLAVRPDCHAYWQYLLDVICQLSPSMKVLQPNNLMQVRQVASNTHSNFQSVSIRTNEQSTRLKQKKWQAGRCCSLKYTARASGFKPWKFQGSQQQMSSTDAQPWVPAAQLSSA